MSKLPEFTLIEFPGFIKPSENHLEERMKPVYECFGGKESITKYLNGDIPKLNFSFRPNDKCSSTLPVKSEKCKNKIVINIKNNKITFVGTINKQLYIDSIAPFQVIDRCPLNILLPTEQPINPPLEINTIRMTKVERPITSDLKQCKEKERTIIESHPHSLSFRKSKTKTKKEQETAMEIE